MELKYQNISHLEEITAPNEAQRYLDLGWVLINSVSVECGSDSYFKILLGWPGSKGNPVTPPSQYPALD